ncbi:MAG: Phosphoglucomutase-3 [Pycnora praestabilis]|nr:MAG: Phosphoglucomutase-3 [Pycnora praestabilis]
MAIRVSSHSLENKDHDTRGEIRKLLEVGNKSELEKRLGTRIAFGTAGLRGRMEAGYSRVNSLTIIQASQGLASYLLDTVPSASSKGIVIGYDARYNSEKFARLAATAFITKGIKVWWYGNLVHTPLVPFGVTIVGAAAGVMVTASHNPAEDNGYKVYWSNGCQIIPPHDAGIAASITRNLYPISWDQSLVEKDYLLVEDALTQVRDPYFAAVTRTARRDFSTKSLHESRFIYTPMHGVGLAYMTEAVERLGLVDCMIVVEEQAHPDPRFPTVRFPNPEENGALDLAIKTAERHDVHLIIANDPDADRLAVAEKVNGRWYQLTGNQLGCLLASHVLSTFSPIVDRSKLAMLNSTVSTGMLRSMASQEGFHSEETLTGFKWLGNVALQLEAQGYDALYAFEEALGYMFSEVVHDKDAVTAGAVFLSAASRWRATENLTPWGKLQQLYTRYGYFETANTYFISPDPVLTERLFEGIRSLDSPHPAKLGNRRILRWRDLTKGYDSATVDNLPLLPVSKDSQMITCELEGDVIFTVRGSGTEPKIKLYIECQADTLIQAQKGADDVLKDIAKEWFKPEANGLQWA